MNESDKGNEDEVVRSLLWITDDDLYKIANSSANSVMVRVYIDPSGATQTTTGFMAIAKHPDIEADMNVEH